MKYYFIYMILFTLFKVYGIFDYSWWWLILPLLGYYLIWTFLILFVIILVGQIIRKHLK